jgi:hypothetical protein
MVGFLDEKDDTEPSVFIQWKGTDVCMDFYCDCGAQGHFDGDFAYAVKCQHCNQIWEMPCKMFPRKASAATGQYWIDNAQPIEPDPDFCEQVEKNGVIEFIPHPVPEEE